jgi:nucleotide-binding universal stress UspA family protein
MGVAVRTEVVRSDDVADAIRGAADRLAADVICIGSHGHSGVAGAVLGSVAQGVVSKSRRPVLVVRPPVE